MDSKSFEKEYVHKFYNKKSQNFSASRFKPWPFTEKFIKEETTDTDFVLDAGCGNGRQFMHPNIVGVDFSEGLLKEASKKSNMGLVMADIHSLPFQGSVFDIVLSIAVVHHLCTHERRLESLLEIKRVLKEGGRCLLYVWHKEASRKKKFREIGENEYFVSWKGEEDLLRYYCLFDEEMLRNLIEEAGFEIERIKREQESIYGVIRKPKGTY
ncbi:hypothetical protein GINT2_001401 [Glugoides intestinalis]